MLDPYTYRCPAGHPDPCLVCTGAPHFEEILQYERPQTVAAVIMETVVGTNGVIVPPDGYLQSIREVCDRHGILLICDEVMAGFGPAGRDALVAGDVLAIEPVLWNSRIGEVRFEDLVLVTEHGCETLTRFPYDIAPSTWSVAVAGHHG